MTKYYKNIRMQETPNFVSISGMDSIQMSIIHDNTCGLIHRELVALESY